MLAPAFAWRALSRRAEKREIRGKRAGTYNLVQYSAGLFQLFSTGSRVPDRVPSPSRLPPGLPRRDPSLLNASAKWKWAGAELIVLSRAEDVGRKELLGPAGVHAKPYERRAGRILVARIIRHEHFRPVKGRTVRSNIGCAPRSPPVGATRRSGRNRALLLRKPAALPPSRDIHGSDRTAPARFWLHRTRIRFIALR